MANRVTRADLEKGIVELAATDDAFRRQLLASPKKALADAGFQLPAGVEITVLAEQPNVYYLLLPAKPAEGELADQELAGVAGGLGTLTTQTTAIVSPTSTLVSAMERPLTLTAATAAQQLPDPKQSGWNVSWP